MNCASDPGASGDFRKRFDGLLAEAFQLGADPYDGDCVLFVKRDHTQLRAVVGDGVGLYLICRRFEGGRLRNLAAFAPQPGAAEISTGELSLLLEGANFTVHQRARAWRGREVREADATSPQKVDVPVWK